MPFQFIFLQFVTRPASRQADEINRLFNFFNIAAAGMLLLVIGLVIYICVKFRSKTDDPAEKQGKKNGKLEALMIGGPALLVLFFLYETITTMAAVAPAVDLSKATPDIIITAHQWWWEAEYPHDKVFTANEIHLPAGRPLLMEMRSADVIHDWWVPELGNKIDMVPGMNNYLSLFIKQPGKYSGTCSEFCGAEHAWMRIRVVAETDEDFHHWIDSNKTAAKFPVDSLALTGEKLFMEKTCVNCHRIAGTEAAGIAGPDLTHVSARRELLTGILINNEANLFNWINHPQQIKPAAKMPELIMDRDSIKAIAHYLAGLN